jgi:hypothetical protein
LGKLTKIVQGKRIAQALEVMRMMANGTPRAEACEKVGIAPKVYEYWIARSEEAVDALRRVNNEVQRAQIEMILISQKQALEKLLQEVVTDDLATRDRLAIMAYLDRKLDVLSRIHNAQGQNEDAAAAYLTGPQLIPGQSRLRGATVNVSPRPDGSVDITTYKDGEVVEGQFVERDEDE